MVKDPTRCAVVGARGYARTLLSYIQQLEEEGRALLVASVLRNRAAYPEIAEGLEDQGVRVYDDYAVMLDDCQDEVDLVVLPTAIHSHAPMAITALGAGYNVFLEKPVAGSLAEVDQIAAARDASGRQCAVGFQILYSRVMQTLKRYRVEGRLGRVRSMRILALWPRPPAYYARNSWAGRLVVDGRPVYDSPFNNALAHQIMNMLYLASPAADQAAYPAKTEGELYRAYDIESFDTGCLRVHTADGVEIFFVASHACPVNVDPMMRMEADRASAEFSLYQGASIAWADGTQEAIEWGDFRMDMFDNVLGAVSGANPRPICTLEIARAHVATVEALHRVTPILDVPGEHVSEREGGQRVITGIDEAARHAWSEGKLFSELGVPFA
jgi:predicted dehydrogenase